MLFLPCFSVSLKPISHRLCFRLVRRESAKTHPLYIIGSQLVFKTELSLHIAYGNCFKTAFESLVSSSHIFLFSKHRYHKK